MKWSEFELEVEEDFKLRKDQLDTKLREIPNLHSKYLRHYYREKKKLVELEVDLKSLYLQKWKYYKNDYDFVVDNKHINFYIDGDKEYNTKLLELGRQKNLVEYFSNLLKKCNSLSFDIRNMIEYIKFINGVN